MELMRKFYMADNAGGGKGLGPDDADIRNSEELNEVFRQINSTLTDVSTKLKSSLETQIQMSRAAGEFDEDMEKAAKKSVTALVGELTKGTRALDKTRELVGKVNEGSISSKKIQDKINETRSRQVRIQETLITLERQGVTITAEQEELAAALLEDL